MSKATEVPIIVAKGNTPDDGLDNKGRFTVEIEGHSFVVEPGVTRITAGHPLAKARPDLFEQEGTPTRRGRSRGR